MSGLITDPEILASTTGELDAIGSAIGAARASAAAPTTGFVAAAQDEVSAAVAKLFSAYGTEYQALLTAAEAFHSEFTQRLAAAGSAYAQAEAAGAAWLSGELGMPVQSLLGQTAATGTASAGTGALSSLLTQSGSPVTALIMGGVGNPGPLQAYIDYIEATYVQPLFQNAAINPIGVTTPEQFWPGTLVFKGGVPTWVPATYTFDQSVATGLASLQNSVNQLNLNVTGNNGVVVGYSESATIATEEIRALLALPLNQQPLANQLSFILLGDPNNPVGGLFERFTGFYAPLLDVSFNGATPQSPWHTSVYTIQYDGIADFPQYPLNLLADLNAINGIAVHAQYQVLTPTELAGAIPLPTTSGSNTDYYMILTQDLPLLYQVREIPYVGNVIADLVQPDLRVLVDLGYADYGPGGNYADIPTPASLFSVPNPFTVIPALGHGAVQGVQAAMVDLGYLPPSALPTGYPYEPTLNPHLNFYFGQPSVTGLSLLSGAVGDVLRFIPPGTDLPFL